MNKGIFIISLDFELMWGNIESWTVDGYGKTHVANVRKVILRMLELLQQWHVKATFDIVGLIMQKHGDVEIPSVVPSYTKKTLSPYENIINNIKKKDEQLYFAPDIIDTLKSSPYVEIGTQTYCHYYCQEEGQTLEQFDADIETACRVAKRRDIVLKSIVFPRNQILKEYLAICKKYGLTSYRGNAMKFFDVPQSFFDKYKNRVFRLIDSYLNISGFTSYNIDSYEDEIMNIPASRFLRPYSRRLFFLEGLKISRIKKEMKYAARHNEIYHLWWHPHNFGGDLKKNFELVEKIFKFYKELNEEYGMQSMTMSELYSKISRL